MYRGIAIVLALSILLSIVWYLVVGKEEIPGHDGNNSQSIATFKSNDIEISQEDDLATETTEYSVSTSTPLATDIGMDILSRGGNAVDAAIAISYALGLTEPYASGIGGGGGMLIYDPELGYSAVNYRDRAPFSANSLDGMSAIPGFVLGMERLNEVHGTLPMKDLIQPSIDLGEKGFKIDATFASYINLYDDILEDKNDYTDKSGYLLGKDDIFKPLELVESMKVIRDNGSDGFYKGSISEGIVDRTWITSEDLSTMIDNPDIKKSVLEGIVPIEAEYRGKKIVSLPAPFSGITLIQMLKMAEILDIPNPEDDVEGYVNDYITLKELAYSDRQKTHGDPSFYNLETERLVEDTYINNMLSNENLVRSYNDSEESVLTTHFVVVDADGMIVSCTNTLGYFFGSGESVNGVFLNNSMASFSKKTGQINSVEPGKQPRNFTAPTIVEDNDKFLAIGSPGGNMIPEFLFQTLVDYYRFESTLESSIEKNRMVMTPEEGLILEDNLDRDYLFKYDTLHGHSPIYKVSDSFFGAVNAIEVGEGVTSVADTRRNGKVDISSE